LFTQTKIFRHSPTENPFGIHKQAADPKEFDRAPISHIPTFLAASAAHPDYLPTNSLNRLIGDLKLADRSILLTSCASSKVYLGSIFHIKLL
jgi:hypothetical protein